MLLQVVIYGIITGLIYALISTGLSLTWSVMGIVNFAHGEFLLWGLYAAFGLWSLFSLDPFLAIPIIAILIFALGALVYLGVIKRVLRAPGVTALLATFGVSMMLKNLAQFLFTSNSRRVAGTIFSSDTLQIGGVYLRHDYLAAGIGSLILVLAVMLFINKTDLGVAIRAASINGITTQLMGIDTGKIYLITFGLSGACVGAAAALMLPFTTVTPTACTLYSLLAFMVVALGGFGSIRITLLSGVAIGVTEAVGGYWAGTSFKYLIVFVLFLLVIQFNPKWAKEWRA